jgi:heme-degrading monooxygenase HmoA
LWRDDVVITVLEASVAADRASDLERVYRERTAQVPSDIIETFLVRDTGDARVFRIITVWVSREALESMRSSGVKPTGVQIFEAVGATPTLSIFDVVVHRKHK